MKVALASSDEKSINQHFGWSDQYVIYSLDENGFSFEKTVHCPEPPEGEEAKLSYKIEALEGADILYCNQIGPTASKMVHAANIYPIKVNEGESIESALHQLQELLKNNPPLWLNRIYQKSKMKES